MGYAPAPMTSALDAELDALPTDLQRRLAAGGFDRARLIGWSREVAGDKDATNRLDACEPPGADDVVAPPLPGSTEERRLRRLGDEALARGEVALLVLAGGMATRMGSVVKALVEALPGRTFLDLRVAGQRPVEAGSGRAAPLWLMTSEATDSAIRGALGARLDGERVAVFPQIVSLRLQADGALFRDATGAPSLYPTGHGDVPEALARSGLLARFLAGGGKYVWIANLDNLGATIDATLLGGHIDSNKSISVEVVEKAGDKGGAPVRHRDKVVICEDFRLPVGFDAARVPVFNTNTMLVDAAALAAYAAPFTYCVVEKKVDGRPCLQRERLLGELTFHLDARYVRVPRAGKESRFLPVKDPDELARRRPEIEAVARQRGML